MADERPELRTAPLEVEAVRGAVIVGVVPDQHPRVVKEAAKFAAIMKAPLVVAHVDVTRFVTYEDPDGYVHSAPIDVNIAPGETDLDLVRASVAHALEGMDVDWRIHQLVGDPALALKHLADQIDARLLVVGTRKRGIGESIREFFTGSVAARLAHRQARPILVVPLGEPAPDDEELWPVS
ncbi:universal stress protein [Microbacterium sp. bgisy207]|uniref:universal stress protein n=1 Tax=Microbacterium sp. bgisy207 TaxID=3413800 RepID=UPI003EBB58B2